MVCFTLSSCAGRHSSRGSRRSPGACVAASAPWLAVFISRRTRAKYRLPQVRAKLAFQLLNRVGPLERLSGSVVVSNEVQNGLLKLIQAAEMVRLQEFALKQTEPDLQLVEPRGVGRQPRELHHQFSLRHRRQFLDPAWELLGRMGRSIIQDQ